MKKILTIGSAMQDIFIAYDNPEIAPIHTHEKNASYICLQAGKKIEVDDIAYSCGGGAANSAVSFARLGFDAAIFCKVGTDQAGDFIINTLKSENINIDHIARTSEKQTGNSFIIPGPQGNSAVLIYRGANTTLTKDELLEQAILQCDRLYITSLSGPLAPLLIPITQLAKKHHKLIACNPGTSQLRAGADYIKNALKNIDILILNSYEAELLMTNLGAPLRSSIISEKADSAHLPELLQKNNAEKSLFCLPTFFDTVHNYGPKIIVVTNGAEGVYVSDTNAIYFHPSISVDMISSTGAGDAFGSCFVAELSRNTSVEDALRAGVINSSCVIQFLDTQTGLLNKNEIEKRRDLLDKSLLRKYERTHP